MISGSGNASDGKRKSPLFANNGLCLALAGICWDSIFLLGSVMRKRSVRLSSANKLRRQPTNRNQHDHVNPVVAAGHVAAEMIADHEENHGHRHKGVLF